MVATRRDLAVRVQEKLEISNVAAQRIVTAVVEAQAELLVEVATLRIVGLGTLRVVDHPETKARNPQTGGTIVIPPGKRIRFKASRVLRRAVSG